MEGILLRRYGGFYYVESNGQVWVCRLRGRFRREQYEFLPGDRVEMMPVSSNEGVIEALKPRKTRMERPAVANIEQVFVVFSLSEPPPDLELLDRLLFLSNVANIKPIIVWNKADTAKEEYLYLPKIYKKTGYFTVETSTYNGKGIEELKGLMLGKISAFAGPSGVGKSSILNKIEPGLNLKTGTISKKGRRGRHTTRHSELIRLTGGGYIADTPGFSRLDLPLIPRREVAECFPEMKPYISQCKFNSCLHKDEPGCEVVKAVEEGKIFKQRYKHYLIFLDEVIAKEREY
ncbi:MAG: ribosome biosis GTPase / thiamine phosphate phosphatase [Clostridia bacterium]|nr:ribosome biosis GTPase / thiamine phosphate phosphatase [Clostridia bacterium]